MGLSGKRSNKVVVANHVPKFRIRTKQLIALTQVVLAKLGYRNTFLSLVLVSDAMIKRLNKQHLNHSWVTDVLAFPFSNSKGVPNRAGVHSFLGEIVISPKRAQVYSKEFQVPFQEEFVRYVCHGVLHLKGYADHSKRTRKIMRHAEDRLIKLLSAKIKGVI